MKSISYERTLFYYDGPQVFEARDSIGGHYIAVAMATELSSEAVQSQEGAHECYLVAGVSPERLRQFRTGAIDLRSLLIESDEDERYMATAVNGVEDGLQLAPFTTPLLESEHLPDKGFLLHTKESWNDSERKSGEALTNWRDHITVDPEVCHGRACISGTRVLVTTVLDNLAGGLNADDIARSYPSVSPDAVRAALCYASALASERIVSFRE